MTKRSLIVGLGQIGMGYDLAPSPPEHFYSHAKSLAAHPAFELSGAVDPNPEQRERFSSHYQKPAFADLKTALHHIQPELVIIATPTPQHAPIVATVLREGKPHVILCEKPLAYTLTEAEKIVESCAQAQVALYINYIRRSDPSTYWIQQHLSQITAAGHPIKAVAWYSKGLAHNGSHLIELLVHWLGPVTAIHLIQPGRPCNHFDAEPDFGLSFTAGEAVFLAGWEEAYSHYTLELVSAKGRLRYDQGGKHIVWQPAHKGQLASEPQLIHQDMNRYQWNVLEQLARAWKGQSAALCTGTEALTTTRYITEILTQREHL